MDISNKRIAIVGGGPGGLTLARLLQLKNLSVKVYERDTNKEARMIGSPLDMHEGSGMAALQHANLLEEFKKNFRPGADKKIIVNEHAEIIFSDHGDKHNTDFANEDFRPEIDRGPLRRMLLESLQPETVVWNCQFISMEKKDSGWLLHFKSGESYYADIVVAADGANSKIRPYITDIKAFYSGITMLEASVHNAEKTIPDIYRLLNGGKLMAFGSSKNLLMGMKEDGELTFYASLKINEDWFESSGLDLSDNTQMLEWFKEKYYGWSSVWYKLFEYAETPMIARPIYCMPVDQNWESQPNLTILGDAAHVMPPFAGEGANMAMLDALELSGCLSNEAFSEVQTAIVVYESAMRKRAAEAAKESLRNGEKMHDSDALENMLELFGIK